MGGWLSLVAFGEIGGSDLLACNWGRFRFYVFGVKSLFWY